jgi:hypothetical protein
MGKTYEEGAQNQCHAAGIGLIAVLGRLCGRKTGSAYPSHRRRSSTVAGCSNWTNTLSTAATTCATSTTPIAVGMPSVILCQTRFPVTSPHSDAAEHRWHVGNMRAGSLVEPLCGHIACYDRPHHLLSFSSGMPAAHLMPLCRAVCHSFPPNTRRALWRTKPFL